MNNRQIYCVETEWVNDLYQSPRWRKKKSCIFVQIQAPEHKKYFFFIHNSTVSK